MLTFHIIIAITLVVSTVLLTLLALLRVQSNITKHVAAANLVLTFVSGGVLAFMFGGIGRFCVTMTITTVFVVLAIRFYEFRLAGSGRQVTHTVQ